MLKDGEEEGGEKCKLLVFLSTPHRLWYNTILDSTVQAHRVRHGCG